MSSGLMIISELSTLLLGRTGDLSCDNVSRERSCDNVSRERSCDNVSRERSCEDMPAERSCDMMMSRERPCGSVSRVRSCDSVPGERSRDMMSSERSYDSVPGDRLCDAVSCDLSCDSSFSALSEMLECACVTGLTPRRAACRINCDCQLPLGLCVPDDAKGSTKSGTPRDAGI